MRVLVVEPHPFQLFDVQSVFFDMGCYRVFPVMGLEDLDTTLKNCQESFDLAMCTSGAFDLSDQELARRICAKSKVANLIMLTGDRPLEGLEQLHKRGFKHIPLLGFLPKPLSPISLRGMVERMNSPADSTLSA